MIILGIDPGTAHTGYGVVKVPDDILGREFEYGKPPVTDYTGPQIKLLVAGAGRADKKQIQEAVRKWLGNKGEKRAEFTKLKGGPIDDAIDAVAIAICHVLKLAAK